MFRVPASVVVCCATLLVFAADAQRLGRDAIDPPPPRTAKSNQKRPQQTQPRSPQRTAAPEERAGETFYADELTGFPVGSPYQERSLELCERVSTIVRTMPGNGRLLIIVTGTADGIPNDGLSIQLDRLPIDCQRAVEPPIKDPELALLRACVITELLGGLLNQSETPIVFEQQTDDIPDGGKSGPGYRLVRIEILGDVSDGR